MTQIFLILKKITKPISVSFSLYFFSPFFYYYLLFKELLSSVFSRFEKLRKLLKPSSLFSGRSLHANLHAKIAGCSTAQRRAAVNHKDLRLFSLERGSHFSLLSSLSLSLSFSLSRWKQKIAVRYRTFTAALRLLSKTGRPRQPILSLHRRFYAPLMEPKLRTIGRSTTPRAS